MSHTAQAPSKSPAPSGKGAKLHKPGPWGKEKGEVAMDASTLTTFEIAAFIASGASLILAILAIALALVFFWMTNRVSQQIGHAANRIENGVSELDKELDRLGTETFGFTQRVYGDMQRLLPIAVNEAEIEQKVDERLHVLKEDLSAGLDDVISSQQQDVQTLKQQAAQLFDRAIAESRKVDDVVRRESLRQEIMQAIWPVRGPQGVLWQYDTQRDDRWKKLEAKGYAASEIWNEIRRMIDEGLVIEEDVPDRADVAIYAR